MESLVVNISFHELHKKSFFKLIDFAFIKQNLNNSLLVKSKSYAIELNRKL
jgi:hypothetical protein